jgi:rare lipoprotein A
MMPRLLVLALSASLVAAPARAGHHDLHHPHHHHPARLHRLHGVASWYGPGFYGRRTASGERFNGRKLTAAHNSIPLGSHVRVVDLRTHRAVTVRVNDRGVAHNRIDLSPRAAALLHMKHHGIDRVTMVWSHR